MSTPTISPANSSQEGFASRLRVAVSLCGGPSALARAIGRSEGAVRKWLRAESEPNVSDLRAICAACGASAEWLINGIGDSRLILHAVRETPATYQPVASMDDALLEEIMIAVDEATTASGSKIAINRKSGMITALYGLCRASRTVDRSAVARLIKLAV